jgi:hypothetical protein
MAAFGLLVSFASQAAPPAGAPAGATALCKDGSYFSGTEKKGACSGHKGLKTWFGASSTKSAPAAKIVPGTKSAAAPVKPNPAATAPAKPAAANAKPAAPAKPIPSAAKPGMVWANLDTKVYHCPNSRWYGKTKNGKYLSEADAKAQGMHPDRNKACS